MIHPLTTPDVATQSGRASESPGYQDVQMTRLASSERQSLCDTAEFFVHHEDVLRGGSDWSARQIPSDLESALWGIVTKVARLHFARSRVGVVLVAPSYGRRQVHAMTDLGTVVIAAHPAS